MKGSKLTGNVRQSQVCLGLALLDLLGTSGVFPLFSFILWLNITVSYFG